MSHNPFGPTTDLPPSSDDQDAPDHITTAAPNMPHPGELRVLFDSDDGVNNDRSDEDDDSEDGYDSQEEEEEVDRSNLPQLPVEIWRHIFEFYAALPVTNATERCTCGDRCFLVATTKRKLWSLPLVCKMLHWQGQELLYKDISHLNTKEIRLLLRTLRLHKAHRTLPRRLIAKLHTLDANTDLESGYSMQTLMQPAIFVELLILCAGSIRHLTIDMASLQQLPTFLDTEIERVTANVETLELKAVRQHNETIFLAQDLVKFISSAVNLRSLKIGRMFESMPDATLPLLNARLTCFFAESCDIGGDDLSAILASSLDTLEALSIGANQYLSAEALISVAQKLQNAPLRALSFALMHKNVADAEYASWASHVYDILTCFTKLTQLRLFVRSFNAKELAKCAFASNLKILAVMEYNERHIDQDLSHMEIPLFPKLCEIYSTALRKLRVNANKIRRNQDFLSFCEADGVKLIETDLIDWHVIR